MTSKYASRQNRVHFFDSSTSQSGPNMYIGFLHFFDNGVHFFDISTSKSVPTMAHSAHFDLLRAATACTFSTVQRPKVVRPDMSGFYNFDNGVHFFDISTSKSAPTVVQFAHVDFDMCFGPQGRANFISHLPRWLRTRGFCEPTAYFSTLQSHKALEKYSVSTFSRPCIFFFLPLSSLTLPTSAFPSVHIVGNLTSKLPSAITCQYLKQSNVYPWISHLVCDDTLGGSMQAFPTLQKPRMIAE